MSNWTRIESKVERNTDEIWKSYSPNLHTITLSLRVTYTNYAYKSIKYWGRDQGLLRRTDESHWYATYKPEKTDVTTKHSHVRDELPHSKHILIHPLKQQVQSFSLHTFSNSSCW